MNNYRVELEVWADSAQAIESALQATPLYAVIIDMHVIEPTLSSATDDELRQELHQRDKRRLSEKLRAAAEQEVGVALEIASVVPA